MEYKMLTILFLLSLLHCTALSSDDMPISSTDNMDYYSDYSNSPPTPKPIVRNPSRVKIKFHKTTALPTSNSPDKLDNNMISMPLEFENTQNMLNPTTLDNSVLSNMPKPSGRSTSPDIISSDLSNPDDSLVESTTTMISSKPVTIRVKDRLTRTKLPTTSSTEHINDSNYPDIGGGLTNPATTSQPSLKPGRRRRLRTRKPTSISTEATTFTLKYQDSFSPNKFTDSISLEITQKPITNKGPRFANQKTTSTENPTPSTDILNAEYSENDIINNTTTDSSTTTTSKVTTFRSKFKQATTLKPNKYTRTTSIKSTSASEMTTTGEPGNDEILEAINPTTSSQYNPTNMDQKSSIQSVGIGKLTTKVQVEPTGKPKYIPYKARSKSSSITSPTISSFSKTYSRFNKKTSSANSVNINPTASSDFEEDNNSSKMASTHTYGHYTRKVTSSMSSSTSSRTFSRYTKPTTTSKSTSKYSRYTKYTRSTSSTIIPEVINPSISFMDEDINLPASVVAVDEYMDSMPTTKTYKLKDNGEIVDPDSLPTSTSNDF